MYVNGGTSACNNLGRVLVQTMDGARQVLAGTRREFPIVSRRAPGLSCEEHINNNNNRFFFPTFLFPLPPSTDTTACSVVAVGEDCFAVF